MEPQEVIDRIARKLSNIVSSMLKNDKEYEPYNTGNQHLGYKTTS